MRIWLSQGSVESRKKGGEKPILHVGFITSRWRTHARPWSRRIAWRGGLFVICKTCCRCFFAYGLGSEFQFYRPSEQSISNCTSEWQLHTYRLKNRFSPVRKEERIVFYKLEIHWWLGHFFFLVVCSIFCLSGAPNDCFVLNACYLGYPECF